MLRNLIILITLIAVCSCGTMNPDQKEAVREISIAFIGMTVQALIEIYGPPIPQEYAQRAGDEILVYPGYTFHAADGKIYAVSGNTIKEDVQ
jgi:hypothetical protein